MQVSPDRRREMPEADLSGGARQADARRVSARASSRIS
jgi:hypothetical protein